MYTQMPASDTLPAGKPPPGQVSNFIDPESLRPATIGVGTVMTVLAVTVVSISLLEHIRKLRLADLFSGIGLAFAIGYASVTIAASYTSKHIWDVPFDDITQRWIQLTFAQGLLIAFAMYFAKTAIFLFYLHIFKIDNLTRYAIYGGMVFTLLLYLPNIWVDSVYCAPHNSSENWIMVTASMRCQNIEVWGVIQAALAVVLDTYIFVLPLPMLAGLKLERRKKVGVLVVFGIAIIGIVASVTTLAFRVQLWRSRDATWIGAENFICSMVESYTAVIVANLIPAASILKRTVAKSPDSSSRWSSRFVSAFRTSNSNLRGQSATNTSTYSSDGIYSRKFNESLVGLRHSADVEIYAVAMVESRPDLVEEGQVRMTVEVEHTTESVPDRLEGDVRC